MLCYNVNICSRHNTFPVFCGMSSIIQERGRGERGGGGRKADRGRAGGKSSPLASGPHISVCVRVTGGAYEI